jgi:HNH endonuclease
VSLREEVARRAGYICKYCRLPDGFAAYPHQQDHIISEHLEGETILENLALACVDCNRYKGPAVAAIDGSGAAQRLFNPRTQSWKDHFRLRGAVIEPISPIGEATVRALKMNLDRRIQDRAALQRSGCYPKK